MACSSIPTLPSIGSINESSIYPSLQLCAPRKTKATTLPLTNINSLPTHIDQRSGKGSETDSIRSQGYSPNGFFGLRSASEDMSPDLNHPGLPTMNSDILPRFEADRNPKHQYSSVEFRPPHTRGELSALEVDTGDANLYLPGRRARTRLHKGRVAIAITITSRDDRDYAVRVLSNSGVWECHGSAAVVVRFDQTHTFHLTAPSSIIRERRCFHYFMLEGIVLPTRRVSLADPLNYFGRGSRLPPLDMETVKLPAFESKPIAFRKLLCCSPVQDLLAASPIELDFQPSTMVECECLYDGVIGAIITVTNRHAYSVSIQPQTTHPETFTISPPRAAVVGGSSISFVVELTGPAPEKMSHPYLVFMVQKKVIRGNTQRESQSSSDSTHSRKNRCDRYMLAVRCKSVREFYVTSQDKPSVFGLQAQAFSPVVVSQKCSSILNRSESHLSKHVSESPSSVRRRNFVKSLSTMVCRATMNGRHVSMAPEGVWSVNNRCGLDHSEGPEPTPASRVVRASSSSSGGMDNEDNAEADVSIEIAGLTNMTFRQKMRTPPNLTLGDLGASKRSARKSEASKRSKTTLFIGQDRGRIVA